MYSDEINEVIENYLRNTKSEYAIMIDGDWGTGKTYFLTHSLKNTINNIDNGKKGQRRVAYVSLYGVRSIAEVSKEILFQFFGTKNTNKTKVVKGIIETASNVLTASIDMINIDLSKMHDVFNKINIKNWIICFDDLERCGMPINEILGYMNRLVEHNKCKLIVLANEKEIGKINTSSNLEEKYQVVLQKIKLDIDQGGEKKKNSAEGFDLERLREEVQSFFAEDILYGCIREKVIGLTIKFETKIEEAYDSIAEEYCKKEIHKFLLRDVNKNYIIKELVEKGGSNLRTLISIFESIQKIYEKMKSKNYNTDEYFDQIMTKFLKYISFVTIYYKNGGKMSDLEVEGMGYISLEEKKSTHIIAFEFLNKYCTTLSFDDDQFESVVSKLREEYKEEDRLKKLQEGYGKAYKELNGWWEKEDEEVVELIDQLKNEVRNNQYPLNMYQKIIALFIELEFHGVVIGNLDELIETMNQNIEHVTCETPIERYSYIFMDNPELNEKYNKYVDKLILKKNKGRVEKTKEVNEILKSDEWADALLKYCEENYNDFGKRWSFTDLIDVEVLMEKTKKARNEELYTLKAVFQTVYNVANIRERFEKDRKKLQLFRDEVKKMDVSKPVKRMAIENLKECLDDIIKRLERN